MTETLGKCGAFELIERIGLGSSSAIFLARPADETDGREIFALKWVRPDADDRATSTGIIDESRIARSLEHPHICRVHGFGAQDGRLFIVMEFIHGQTLRRVLDRARAAGTSVPFWVSAALVADMAGALDYLHAKCDGRGAALKIIHRDVNPRNVMVSYNGSAKLIDFGIARAEGRIGVTLAGQVKGKSAYMAPEQAMGMNLDARTDVFGAGILLYEMVVGERPFQGDTDEALLRAAANCEFRPAREARPDIPDELGAIIDKAMERNPRHRYDRAGDMQAELGTFVAGARGARMPSIAAFMELLFHEDRMREEERNRRLLDRG
jgi:serine/threonine protein kinase